MKKSKRNVNKVSRKLVKLFQFLVMKKRRICMIVDRILMEMVMDLEANLMLHQYLICFMVVEWVKIFNKGHSSRGTSNFTAHERW